MMEEIYCFAGNPLDRMSEHRRDKEWVASLLADPASRILPLYDLKPAIRDLARPALEWQKIKPWRAVIDAGAMCIFLGIDDGRAYFAVDASGTEIGSNAAAENVDLRALAPQIPAGDAAILAEARSLIDWHTRHGFCAQCGTKTDVSSAGWTRHCPNCRASHYPRSDPVTIMLVVRGERALLGRNKRRPGQRFSCLAGFMEPGETPEEAVRREVKEESGIGVGRVKYLAAQPWPFPSTLMMGFLAEGISEDITIDPEELAEARWFERDEIRAMVARAASGEDDPTQISLPQPLAIAHHLCRRWSNGLDEI
jgi:NAD+ diphosphatase